MCFYPICDATYNGNAFGFYFAKACADYMSANCCQLVKVCMADATCADCFLNGSDPACNTNTFYAAFTTCHNACP